MSRYTTNTFLLLMVFFQGCGPQVTSPQFPIVTSQSLEDTPSFFDCQEIWQEALEVNHDVAGVTCTATKERYKALVNQVKPGMSQEQVEAILGMADESVETNMGELNPQMAGQILDVLTWYSDTNSESSIVLGFVNGRLRDGGTFGYDIRKGFKSQLPANRTTEENASLKEAANGLGFTTRDE